MSMTKNHFEAYLADYEQWLDSVVDDPHGETDDYLLWLESQQDRMDYLSIPAKKAGL